MISTRTCTTQSGWARWMVRYRADVTLPDSAGVLPLQYRPRMMMSILRTLVWLGFTYVPLRCDLDADSYDA
jgi:hypothetical protein